MDSTMYFAYLIGVSGALIVHAKVFLEIAMLSASLKRRRHDVCIAIILFMAISYVPMAFLMIGPMFPDRTIVMNIAGVIPVISLFVFLIWQINPKEKAPDSDNKQNGHSGETTSAETEAGTFRRLVNALPLVNDFWFLTKENKNLPYDPEVEYRSRSRYRAERWMHPILILFAFLVFWPIGVLILLVYFIRRTKYAHYNHKLYEAEYEGKPFEPPSDNRLVLYITAAFIVAAGYYAHHFVTMAIDYIFLLLES